MKVNVRFLAYAGVIAAVYTVFTVMLAPISYGLMQCRVSEALCVLPYFTDAAVPGLFIGCLLSNLIGGAPIYDVIFGSLATLLAATATFYMRNRWSWYLAPLPPVVFNGLIVGAMLVYVYGVDVPLWLSCLYVAAGEGLACYGLGLPLICAMEKYENKLFPRRM